MSTEGSGYEALGIIPELDPNQAVLRCRSDGTLLLYSDQEIHEELHTFIDQLAFKVKILNEMTEML